MAKLYEIIEEIRIKLLLRKILVLLYVLFLLYVFYNLLLILTFSPIFSYGLQKKKKKKKGIGDDILKCGAINRAKRGILISLELNNIRV